MWTLRVEEQRKQMETPEGKEKILDGFILRGKGERDPERSLESVHLEGCR